jgi:hypothetical protein
MSSSQHETEAPTVAYLSAFLMDVAGRMVRDVGAAEPISIDFRLRRWLRFRSWSSLKRPGCPPPAARPLGFAQGFLFGFRCAAGRLRSRISESAAASNRQA